MSQRRRRRTQQERVDESSRRLIAAAIELFAKNGYNETTAKEISLTAGYSRAMLSERFGSKRVILEAIMSEYESRSAGDLGAHPSGFDRVVASVNGVCRVALEDPGFTRAVSVMSFGAVHDEGDLRDRIRQWLFGMRQTLCDALRAGVSDGSIDSAVDPDGVALKIMMAWAGFDFYWIVLPEFVDYVAGVHEWRQRIIDTLRPDVDSGARIESPAVERD
ncbi:TetR/AcrR family transcriptional regulator [Mycolicibacterium goodii]|uniref:TetR/AcrR family transcriptional regulator n=1 Tax=Mycolicibacterium goodii TaxID=134601 RepID=UPI001BDBF5D2|nr:TetR/AcrR family transcriptional regulator [Mycolicibacterium goodii]MBU8820497.1 TetR/AcrR family transcriptional regulator [Mycolicibacterium goodii]